jgi:1-acyl-sn-glycerol-3-phosphate acyltransferase
MMRARGTRTTAWTGLKQALLGLFGLCVRIRVVGRSRLPLKRGVIVAANHLTGADSLVIQLALRSRLFFVTSARWLAGRVSGFWMARVCDSVPAENGAGYADVAGLRQCLRTLREGGSVGIYPEGRLNRAGRVDEIHDGCAWLAARSGRPVLPVCVRNLKLGPEPHSRPWLNEAWEGFFSVVGNVLNTDIEVLLGEPIVPRPGVACDPERLRGEIRRINAELRQRFDELARPVSPN